MVYNVIVKRPAKLLTALLVTITLSLTGVVAQATGKALTVFCGAASKPAMEEAAKLYENRTNTRINLLFGGSGTMLSQMKLSKRGDVFIPGSPDYMTKAERDGMIDPKTIKILAYLVPAIGVQPGNPKGIRALADLARPGVSVAIGAPESVCVGLYAIEILEQAGLRREVMKNVVTHAHSCAAVENLLVMKKVDVVLGWDAFSKWHPGKIETVFLKPHNIPRLAYIPAAVATSSASKETSGNFIEFLASPEGKKIFEKWGYITSEKGARAFAPKAKIGGEYKLPVNYLEK